MKIAMLAAAHKIHTNRWSRWLADNGHEVVLFSDTTPPAHLDYSGVRHVGPEWTFLRSLYVYKIRGGALANDRHKWRAYDRVIRREKPDLLHAQEALAYGPTLAHFPQFPRVLTPWGPDMESLKGENREVRELVIQGAQAADVITTNAPGLEEHWCQLTGVPRDKFRLFSWGVDIRQFRPRDEGEASKFAAGLGIPAEATVLLSPRLARRYCRIDMILRAWKEVLDDLPDNAHLLVLRAGATDQDWQDLQALAREEAIGRVRFVDQNLTPDQMALLYTRCRGTVMVPLTDLVAMSLLECMACGSIPLLVGHPCYRETVADLRERPHKQGHGIYAPEGTVGGLADAIRRWGTLKDDEVAKISLRNHEYIQKHQDWSVNAKQLLDAYQEVLN